MSIRKVLLRQWMAFCCVLLSAAMSAHAEEPGCVLGGELKFDSEWVKVINEQMHNHWRPTHMQRQWVQFRSVTEPIHVIDVYTGDVFDQPFSYPEASINIPQTSVECGQQYRVYFAYQIYALGPSGDFADFNFTARPDNKPMVLTYPTDFQQSLCQIGSRDCMPQLKLPPQPPMRIDYPPHVPSPFFF